MPDVEGSSSKETKSSLSVNANIFVPRAIPVPSRQGGAGVGGVPYPGTVTPGPQNPLQEIPAYMINCYPFVQEDGTRKSTAWPPSVPAPYPRYRDQTPPGGAGPHHFKGQGRGKNAGLNRSYPNVVHQGAGVPAPFRFITPTGGHAGRFPMATVPPTSPRQQQYYGGDFTRPIFNQNHHWPPRGGQGQGHATGQGHGQRPLGREGQRPGGMSEVGLGKAAYSGEGDTRNFDRGKRERRNSGKAAGRAGTKPSGKWASEGERGGQSAPRTLILHDRAAQTDFEENFSMLRLQEKPNSLYKISPHRTEELSKGGDFSPSEEVDSDSGYSSPLHRRNMVSIGTDPVDPQLTDKICFVTTGSCQTSQTAAPQSRMSYAAIAQKAPTVRIPAQQIVPTVHDNTDSKKPTRGKAKNRTVSKSEKGLGENIPRRITSPSGNVQRTRQDSKSEDLPNSEEKTKKKRKRVRKRRKKGEITEGETAGGTKPSNQDVDHHDVAMENVLHFEDEEEFPDLVSTNPSTRGNNSAFTAMSFSQILKTSGASMPGSPPKSGRTVSFLPHPLHLDDSDQEDAGMSESKTARKRRKRREKANKAAEEELAEITLEQHMLRELNLKRNQPQSALRQPQTLAQRLISNQPITVSRTVNPQVVKEPIIEPKPKASGKKSQQPIAFDIGAIIEALEHKKPDKASSRWSSTAGSSSGKKSSTANVLDSNAPAKRGKERENPKPKKPSSLKKVILKEREERKRIRIIGEDPMMATEMGDMPRAAVGVGVVTAESDLSQDGVDNSESEGSRVQGVPIPKGPGADVGGTPATSDLSPVSQMSPISMTPLSSGVNSPIVGHVTKEVTQAALKIHSRRFREYCHQVLDKEIDACCTTLLQDLVKFQDRAYHKDPTKAKSKRRIVLGLREVTKHLRLKKIKCVIISPNLEKIQSKGGLDEALNKIIELCNEQNIPFVFALGRRALGRACAKLVPVSVAGIFNYDGSEGNFQQLMDLTAVGRQAYKDMVSILEREIMEHPVKVTSHIYAHMGHSRTPSACSAISFTSSVLSEPISENYPQSEPEVDSKGNEIIKDVDLDIGDQNSDGTAGNATGERTADKKITDSKDGAGHGRPSSSSRHVDDIDDGNEADTEDVDCADTMTQPALTDAAAPQDKLKLNAQHGEDYEEDEDEEDFEDDSDDDSDDDDGNEDETQAAREVTSTDDEVHDDVEELPHIDSFHASTHDLSAEILSQHSARTGDTVEGASTHSSKTVGDGSSTRQEQYGGVTQEAAKTPAAGAESGQGGGGSGGQQVKIVDRERIKSWVEQSQTCMKLHLDEIESTSESQLDAEGNSSTDDLLDVDAKLVNTHTIDTYL